MVAQPEDVPQSAGRVVYDGLNLALAQGTGVATYTRMLARVVRDLGYEIGVVYASAQRPPKDPLLREVAFFDDKRAIKTPLTRQAVNYLADQLRSFAAVKPVPVDFDGVVVRRQFEATLPPEHQAFATRNLFANARAHFARSNKFLRLDFDQMPDIFHCTYPLPLHSRSARNIYTIHDLVPLRLPFTTLDNKRQMFRVLKRIARQADHIVTVSENSKRDIIALLGVEERRITNTYQAVHFPAAYRDRPDAVIAEQLEGSFGLEFNEYLLFFGALEPKKNVGRLIESYMLSGVDVPLVLVAGRGWNNEAETKLIDSLQDKQRSDPRANGRPRRTVHRYDYVPFSLLVSLVRGARAVLFPSLYEGFGLPVLEAMVLGTPVVTSRESSIPEVAGDAALLVDPYSTDAIAAAIRAIVDDRDLRGELSRRGRAQAANFSVDRYRERVGALYRALA
ncbi:MAG TPA: glycosyltransferase family 1 protein [Stellaceae bacterium]|jgi:glycosyltransferase involved in cell wall biosynthesis